jgi:replication factor C subunit 1
MMTYSFVHLLPLCLLTLNSILSLLSCSISGSKEAVNLDYITHLRDAISGPLIKEGIDGVPFALRVMQDYYLLREDIDSLMEISLWPNQKDPMSRIDSKVTGVIV